MFILDLGRRFFVDLVTLGRYYSVYHLVVTVFCVSKKICFKILLDFKNIAVNFFFEDRHFLTGTYVS